MKVFQSQYTSEMPVRARSGFNTQTERTSMKLLKKLAHIALPAALCLTCIAGSPFSSAPEAAEPPSDEAYGSAAYSYLDTLVHTYPQRTNNENARSQADIDAGLWIRSQLESMGYTVSTQDYEHLAYTGTNYYVTKPGSSDRIVCIGAHYDCADTTGTDDNGSGVSILLELANRFFQTDTPCTLQFVFFDNEEQGGFVGSYNYVNYVLKEQQLLDDVLCYINLDSVGGGDRLYAYGGVYDENGRLDKIWPYNLANACADELGISLYTLPEQVEEFQTPTRYSGSDQHYFREEGIPYLYLEAGLWCDDDGSGGNDETRLTCHYQTADPAFASTGGQIMHTEFDSLDTLNTLLPGRIQSNLTAVSRLVSEMLLNITEQTPIHFAALPELPSVPETLPQTAPEETEPESSAHSDSVLGGNHSLILILLCFIGALILLVVGFVIYTSSSSARIKRRKRRFQKRRRKKKKNRFE